MTKRLPPIEEQRRRTQRNRRRDRQLVDAAYRDASKIVADQTIVHQREIVTLASNYVRMQNALAAAVKRIDWITVQSHDVVIMTPADLAELEEWRELAK